MPVNTPIIIPPLPKKLELQDINNALQDRDTLWLRLYQNTPYLELEKLTNQTFPTGTTSGTAIVWDKPIISRPFDYRTTKNTLYVDRNGAGEYTRIYCTVPCHLLVSYTLALSGSTAGTVRKSALFKNGVEVVGSVILANQPVDPMLYSITCLMEVAANDYFELSAVQNSGITMTINGVGASNKSSLKVRVLF